MPGRSARDTLPSIAKAGSGNRTPVAWLEARSRAARPIPHVLQARAEGEGVEPSRLIARLISNQMPSPFGLPFRFSRSIISTGGRSRTSDCRLNRAPPYRLATPVSKFAVDRNAIFLHNKFMDFRWNEWNVEHIKMTKAKPYWKMNLIELAKATEQFDKPFIIDESRPLTAAERAQWEKVRRKRGRPKIGKGFKRVSLSLEQDLLRRVTTLAKKRRISRSRLIALVLTDALAQERTAR